MDIKSKKCMQQSANQVTHMWLVTFSMYTSIHHCFMTLFLSLYIYALSSFANNCCKLSIFFPVVMLAIDSCNYISVAGRRVVVKWCIPCVKPTSSAVAIAHHNVASRTALQWHAAVFFAIIVITSPSSDKFVATATYICTCIPVTVPRPMAFLKGVNTSNSRAGQLVESVFFAVVMDAVHTS